MNCQRGCCTQCIPLLQAMVLSGSAHTEAHLRVWKTCAIRSSFLRRVRAWMAVATATRWPFQDLKSSSSVASSLCCCILYKVSTLLLIPWTCTLRGCSEPFSHEEFQMHFSCPMEQYFIALLSCTRAQITQCCSKIQSSWPSAMLDVHVFGGIISKPSLKAILVV